MKCHYFKAQMLYVHFWSILSSCLPFMLNVTFLRHRYFQSMNNIGNTEGIKKYFMSYQNITVCILDLSLLKTIKLCVVSIQYLCFKPALLKCSHQLFLWEVRKTFVENLFPDLRQIFFIYLISSSIISMRLFWVCYMAASLHLWMSICT